MYRDSVFESFQPPSSSSSRPAEATFHIGSHAGIWDHIRQDCPLLLTTFSSEVDQRSLFEDGQKLRWKGNGVHHASFGSSLMMVCCLSCTDSPATSLEYWIVMSRFAACIYPFSLADLLHQTGLYAVTQLFLGPLIVVPMTAGLISPFPSSPTGSTSKNLYNQIHIAITQVSASKRSCCVLRNGIKRLSGKTVNGTRL